MIIRRLKGAIVLAMLWAAGWSMVGLLLFIVQGGPIRAAAPLKGILTAILFFMVLWGVMGFLTGLIVSGVIALAERRRTVDQLSLPRIATWGGLSGVALVVVLLVSTTSTPPFRGPQLLLSLLYTGGCGVLGAALAMAQLQVARRSLPEQRELDELLSSESTAANEIPSRSS